MSIFVEANAGKLLHVKGQPGAISPVVSGSVSGSGSDDSGLPSYAAERVVITRMQLSQDTNHQFLHAFNNTVYVYVFGDRIGALQIGGVCATPCNETPALPHLMRFYRERKLSKRPMPLVVTVGMVPFRAFLAHLSVDASDPVTGVVAFNMRLFVIEGGPDK